MDPLSALSIAASVVQFVDYGTRIVSKSHEINKSAGGASIQNVELGAATKRLQTLTTPLQNLQGDESLKQICIGCIEVSLELEQCLEQLKVPEGHKHRKCKIFRQALKSVARKDEIEEFKMRLHGFRLELSTYVLLDLR